MAKARRRRERSGNPPGRDGRDFARVEYGVVLRALLREGFGRRRARRIANRAARGVSSGRQVRAGRDGLRRR